MNKKEATEKLVNEMNYYPEWVLVKMIGENYEFWNELTPYDSDDEYHEIMPMWGTLFEPSMFEERWALDNLEKMNELGINVYEYDDGENNLILFGINGAGYDFYEQHWIPFYEALGYHWHTEE